MAKAKKNAPKRSTVTKILDAVTELMPRKKATRGQAKSNSKSKSGKRISASPNKSARNAANKLGKQPTKKKRAKSKATTAREVVGTITSGVTHAAARVAGATTSSRKSVTSRSAVAPKSTRQLKTGGTKTYARTMKTALAQKNERVAAKAQAQPDPAHAPGHRKLNIAGLKHAGGKADDNGAGLTSNTKRDRISQLESPQRRVITGGSIERKGRRG